jgi:hypothetical protein
MWFPQWAGYDWELAFSVIMIKLEDGVHVRADIEVFFCTRRSEKLVAWKRGASFDKLRGG